MILQNHYQNAYVTRDIEQAIALFRTRHGFEGFKQFEVANEITTSAGCGTSVLRMALGWIGNLQYELIEPVSGMVDIFKADLPESAMRLHHICMRVHDWSTFRAEVDRRKWPVVIEGSGTGGQLQFIYIDARASIGHYLEYCWMTPERWASMGGR